MPLFMGGGGLPRRPVHEDRKSGGFFGGEPAITPCARRRKSTDFVNGAGRQRRMAAKLGFFHAAAEICGFLRWLSLEIGLGLNELRLLCGEGWCS